MSGPAKYTKKIFPFYILGITQSEMLNIKTYSSSKDLGISRMKGDIYMAKQLTNEEFLQRLKEAKKDFYIPKEKYVRMNVKIKFYCKIHNITFYATPESILRNNFCCPKCIAEDRKKHAHRKTHEEFIREVEENNPGFKVIGTYIDGETKIECECPNGHKYFTLPSSIRRGYGCPECARLARSFTGDIEDSLYTKRPDLIKYFKDPEDAKKVMISSTEEVELVCPDCGTSKNMTPYSLNRSGFHCDVCDIARISYPNRVMINLMKQLPVKELKFEYKIQHENGKYYRYDCSFLYNDVHYLIENDGKQHKVGYIRKEEELKHIKEVDEIKNRWAEDNNMILIRIDCEKSNIDFISNNIINSLLGELFDLSNIDWLEIDRKSSSNLLKDIAKYHNENLKKSYEDIAKIFGISIHTVKKYLGKCRKLGWIK